METHSGINKLKWLGYVAATIGFALNLLIFDGFSRAERSMEDNFHFFLGGKFYVQSNKLRHNSDISRTHAAFSIETIE